KALLEAKEIVQGVRREVNAILEEARLSKSREAREKVAAAEAKVEAGLAALRPGETLVLEKLAPGDRVFVTTLGYDASVVAVDARHERLRVRAGQLEFEVPFAALAPPRGKAAAPRERGRREAQVEESSESINLIGLRVEEAVQRLEKFLDHASLTGTGTLRVVHGKGTGALRRGIRDYLAGHPLVAEFRGGEDYEGGEGVTVVTLR
ncbi:MAG TPA: Smr/MutS family protein, partial [Geobacteraceae bacterium]